MIKDFYGRSTKWVDKKTKRFKKLIKEDLDRYAEEALEKVEKSLKKSKTVKHFNDNFNETYVTTKLEDYMLKSIK